MLKGAVAFLLLVGAVAAQAQIQVDIGLKRTLYLRYEPIMCTVTITNRTGAPLELSDTMRDKWFSFQIETTDGRPLPPLNPDYQNEPVTIAPGQKLSRVINIAPLYPLNEFGTYRVRAAVYSPQDKKYFISGNLNIDITEGRVVATQTVGVPAGAGLGKSRTYSLLTHRLPATTVLYLRVEDQEMGRVFCTSQLGRFVSFGTPDVQIDAANQIHILHNAAPKAYLYTHADVNGKILKQQAYQVTNTRPYMVSKNNVIEVIGGIPFDANAKPPEQQLPKLSDRPVPLPTPQGKATPEDKRPENLLSR